MKRSRYAFEDGLGDAAHIIKQHPFRSLAAGFAGSRIGLPGASPRQKVTWEPGGESGIRARGLTPCGSPHARRVGRVEGRSIINRARVAKLADARTFKSDRVSRCFVLPLKPCGRGEMAYAPDLSANLSARRETGGAELLKVGEPCEMAIPSQARSESGREGVETRRAAPNIPEPSGKW